MRKRLALAVAALVLASGCGTTVRSVPNDVAGQELGGGLVPGATAPGPGRAPQPGADSTGSAAVPGDATTPPSSAPRALPALPTTAGLDGPGVTATTITLGFSYYRNADQANAALGAGGVKTGDPLAGMRVLVEEVNRRGGIAGRTVKVVEWSMDPQSTTPYAASGQQLCTTFTDDHKVFAVIDGAPAAGRAARQCLARHGVLYLGATLLVDGDFVPGQLDVTSLTWDALFAVLPSGLGKQGWYGGWNTATGAPGATPAKLGVLTVDSVGLRRAVDKVLLPAFAAVGHPVDDENVIRIAPPGGVSDNGAVVAALHSAVLRFRTNGVTHVVLTDSNGSMSLLFQNDAMSQGYFPRYGGSTGNGWQVLLDAGSLQAASLRGAMGISFQPLLDTHNPPTSFGSAATRRACWALFSKAGMASTTPSEAATQATVCDVVFFLPTVLAGHRGTLDRSATLAAVDRLGTGYPTAALIRSRLAKGKHYGTGAYAVMAFDEDCSCFRYPGGVSSL